MLAEHRHGIVGKHAVGSAAVCDNGAPHGDLLETLFEFCDRYGAGPSDVSSAKLLLGPHIEDHDISPSKTGKELFICDGLKRLAILQIGFDNS